MMTLINGDSILELKKLKDHSIDSIICDPPYGIGINNKAWDKSLPNQEIWKECFRILKPGGFICAMSGSRLYHRLALSIEGVGFITHQMMVWAYASGFPKGMCLARMMDNHETKLVPDDKFKNYLRSALKAKKISANKVEDKLKIRGMFSHYLGKSQPQFPSFAVWVKLKKLLDLDDSYDHLIKSISEKKSKKDETLFTGFRKDYDNYIPQSKNAIKWHGNRYGLQVLKPAIEPIYVGQKPYGPDMVKNVLKFKTGAINIGRVKKDRYPANFSHDGSLAINRVLRVGVKFFDTFKSSALDRSQVLYHSKPKRDEFNSHPTVKPLSLMENLVKLYTPNGGIVLDPFSGSGTTGLASILNGFKFIGIEKNPQYFEIAKRRLSLEISS